METQQDLVDAIRALAMTANPYSQIVSGSTPPINGICMIQAPSSPASIFKNKGMLKEMSILINAKNADQSLAYSTLCEIHKVLTKTWNYPNSGEFQVIDIETEAEPNLLGREENNQWIYGSSALVKYFWR